jgi:hypothetical protein
MHYWRGVLTHASFLLAQPTYLAIRHLLGLDRLESRSALNLAIHVGIWLYIATRISIPFFKSPLRRLPSPPGEKFLLCHLNFNGGRPPTTLFENFLNDTPNDGLLVLWLPLYLSYELVPTRPDTLMDVLSSHNYDWEKPPLIKRVLSAIVGEGLVNVEGAKHKAMRRVVAPAFSGRLIRDLAPLFYSKGLNLAELISRQAKAADGGIIDLEPLFSRVSLDIIGAAGVGMDFNTVGNEDSRLAKLYNLVMHPPAFFLLVNALFPRWMIRRLGSERFTRVLDAQVQLRREVDVLLQEKKVDMQSDKDSKDIIASIMRSGEFSDDYLMGQLLTFLAAG